MLNLIRLKGRMLSIALKKIFSQLMNNSVYDKTMENLTLIWMGFLGTRIKLGRGGGGVKLPPV